MILSETLSGLAYRFRLIVDGLRKTVPEHQTKNPASCALVGVIWTSLGRRMERFQRILARVEAGIPDPFWPSRAGRRAAPREMDAGGDGAVIARRLRMPTRAGWLMIMMPWKVAPYGTQLRHWLTDPDAEALVRSSRQMRRLLRPLLRSLSTDKLPECLLEPAPEVSDAAADAPEPQVVPDAGTDPAADDTFDVENTSPEASAHTGWVTRSRVARIARRTATVARAALPDVAPATPVPVPQRVCVPPAVDPPVREWWSVQDERRRAALAIARGSVCRG